MFSSLAKHEYFGHIFARLRYHTRRDRCITTKLRESMYKIDTILINQHINEGKQYMLLRI